MLRPSFADSCLALPLWNGWVSYNRERLYGNDVQDRYAFDTVAKFSCKSRYALQGSASSTCQTSTNWNPPPPTCERSINIKIPNLHFTTMSSLELHQFLKIILHVTNISICWVFFSLQSAPQHSDFLSWGVTSDVHGLYLVHWVQRVEGVVVMLQW